MNKILLYVTSGVVVLAALFYILNINQNEMKEDTVTDYKDGEYIIAGQRIKLDDGVSTIEAAPGSVSKIITRYFGNEVKKDLNNDGKEDIVFLLTQTTGGSGVFYYAVAAISSDNGYIGSEAIFIGDRIAPQRTESSQGNTVIINYADRAPGQAFTVQPTVAKSLKILLDPKTLQFGEVVQNFEGEADPSKMSLEMKTWNWVSALYNDGRTVTPKKPGSFSITFSKDGKFTAKTDCNQMGGTYTVKNGNISFGGIYMTKMYCEGSQESVFAKLIEDSTGYHFTSKGELILNLKFDSGAVTFR